MTRVRIVGVIWTTAEDNILTQAVLQYGPEQWPLVASLLEGKTEEQCKGRWDSAFNPDTFIRRCMERRMTRRFRREREIAVAKRLKQWGRAVREAKGKRKRIDDEDNEKSFEEQIDQRFNVTREKERQKKIAEWIDQLLENRYQEYREEMLRIKRRGENNNNTIECNEDREMPRKRAKVVVEMIPQCE